MSCSDLTRTSRVRLLDRFIGAAPSVWPPHAAGMHIPRVTFGKQPAFVDQGHDPRQQHYVGTGNKDQAIRHLGLVGDLQEKLIALQGGSANGPFVVAENIANAAQRVTETLGFKSPGLFFQPPERVAASGGLSARPPQPQDPGVAVAMAQIDIARQAAAADAEIKRLKAQADIDLARWKAEQWAEIERLKVGLKAEVAAARDSTADSRRQGPA